jgi:hypothetical protein
MTTPADQRPLTILIAADTYPPDVNGAAQFGYRLAKGMTARGHNVHVLASRDSKGKSFTEFHGEATVHRLRSHKAFTTRPSASASPGKSRGKSACSSTGSSRTWCTSKATT